MSGPIIRSGPSPQFSKNWDGIFGKSTSTGKKSEKPVAESKPAKKKSAKKDAKPKGGKKKA